MTRSYYKEKYGRQFTPGQGLPIVSTDIDSVRAYQFEVQFFGLPGDITNQADLTLAAKKVIGMEMASEPIAADRINDKLWYPGKVTQGDLVVTFDNLYLRETASDLWRYFKHIYDPVTGEMTKFAQPGGLTGQTFKVPLVKILQLDNTSQPHASADLMGVWPSKYAEAEFNSSTNEFHTIEVTFKYDFINRYNQSNP